ncbi:MAG TPA: DNA polymerase III subunit gamma/tau [Vicinamibacterales bacterium]|nr:DNA polymerase III subunit gamma/tau [Vicinamibacterales bacterium]
MSYQVIARKWRPQQFDDVVGQQAVTRTLRNALKSGRLAQAFVFAGPRGVGKTTTARILARAFNCEQGPTGDPCGRCEACREITDGRDMDVLEIDAATHTGIDNVREVIISGLGIMPVRDRFKIFIIDEVHQLSNASFNSLLKSIEEPPPHVVFMMATTELDKIPETVLSRAQVYEFRTISTKAIAAQLRKIMDAEGITVGEDSLQLIARDAEGSMRDAQSKLDQVIAFTGTTITADDVSTVLGLVGRDLLLDTLQAVADEDAPASFALAARAVEMGYDLRAVCRELSRVVRDVLVLAVDPGRINDPEIAGEGERDRLKALAGRFSREDLLRAFDLLTRAEQEIKSAAQPRYHLEMALLRWIHLRKLVPIEDLIAGAGSGSGSNRTLPERAAPAVARPAPPASVGRPAPTAAPARSAPSVSAPSLAAQAARAAANVAAVPEPKSASAAAAGNLKDALLAEIRKTKMAFYGTVVAQAQKIEVTGDRMTFTFSPNQRALRDMFEQHKTWLESIAQPIAGRRITMTAAQGDSAAAPASADAAAQAGAKTADTQAAARQSALREQALADAGVQTMLEVFPAEIRDVEEM